VGDAVGVSTVLQVVLAVLIAGLGSVISAGHPGHRVALLLHVTSFGLLLLVATSLVVEFGNVPVAPNFFDFAASWFFNVLGSVVLFPVLLILFVFPTGFFLTRRWVWVGWATGIFSLVVGSVVLFSEEVGMVYDPELEHWHLANPIGFLRPEVAESMVSASVGVMMWLAVGGVASMIVRYRRADSVVRIQIKWVVYASAIAAAAVATTAFSDGNQALYLALAMTALSVIPIAITIAITKYKLFEIDRLISRTLAYTLIVATLTIAYLAVTLGVGALAAAMSPTDADLPIPVVATALVAIGFQPVRKRALRIANRLVFGKERTPYEALAGIKEVELDHLLPRIAQLVTESTAARGAVVWLSTGTQLEPAAVFPDGIVAPGPIPLTDGQVPPSPHTGEVFPLFHQRSLTGAITTVMDPGEELPAVDVRLMKDLASHAATTINGVLEAAPLPDGIVTFLMTDIEGSTRLWEEDPERMAVALRKHDDLVQSLIREGGGVLVKWKGEGDSTFSVFTDPGEAVEAALALQEAINTYQWDLVRPISIRAALHTGDAELRERDYFGQTVNRCARIRSLVQGGQTLVSAATRELVRSVARETLTFRDLGEHQLRDFKEPERVYEVIAQTGAGPTEPKQAAGI
jgi:class 3 adenylate cyclase